jgi:cobalt/nickel transport system permease protein
MYVLTEYKHDHMLVHVDARVKHLAALAVLMMVVSYRGTAFPLLITLLCLFLCIRMRIPLRALVLRFSEPLFIAVVVLLLKVFFSGKETLFSGNIIGIKVVGHKDGLMEGLLIGSRIISAVSVVAVLGFATPFTEFMAGLSWFRVPKGFIEILMFAYRYIFVLFEDAQVIYQAQKNRLGYSTVRRGLSSFGTLAGSLTIKAFDHSQNTTVAMVQRGYDGDMPMLMHRPFKSSEIFASTLFLLVIGAVWTI